MPDPRFSGGWSPHTLGGAGDDLARSASTLLVGGAQEPSADALACVWWSVLAEPGDGTAGALRDALGACGALAWLERCAPAVRAGGGIPADELARCRGIETGASGLLDGVRRWLPRLDVELVRGALAAAHNLRASIVIPGTAAWPRTLDDLGHHAPALLWVRGDARLLSMPRSISVVGSRSSTPYGEHVAAALVAGLGERGFVTVSGGAYGIDRSAHRAALGSGHPTVAVLAGGPDRMYPSGNVELLRRIIAEGCVVAESPPGTAPTRWRFLERNRIIAALAAGTVVVEAGARSGALNTAHHAADLGRCLLAVPGPVTSQTSRGANRLIAEGLAQLVGTPDDVIAALADAPIAEFARLMAQEPGLRAEAVRVRDALHASRWRDVSEIARLSGLDERSVAAFVAELVVLGQAEERSDGFWRKPRS